MPVGYPIGVPASPLTANASWIELLSSQGFNVLTYKTIRRLETPALPPPNWLFTEGLTTPLPVGEPIAAVRADRTRRRAGSEPYSMVNSCGIPSPVPPVWQEDIGTVQALRPGQVLLVSVVGEYEELSGQDLVRDFVDVSLLAEEAGAPIIELNLSCPNSVSRRGDGLRPPICESAEDTCQIVAAVRAALAADTKLVAKLGYLSRERLEDVVSRIVDSVDGIAGINTLQVGVQDDELGPVFLGTLNDPNEPRRDAGLSGIAIRDYALDFVRSLALLRRKYSWSFEIIGMGGVMDPHDVRALMASGADAVQTTTAATNNPDLPEQLWTDGHRVPSEEDRLVWLLDAALADRKWQFRTAEGLADELHVSASRSVGFLRLTPIARRSVMNDRHGRNLYVAHTRKPTLRERFEQFRWLLAR